MTMKDNRKKHIILAAVALLAAMPSAMATVNPETSGDDITNVVVRNRVEVIGADSIDSKIISQLAPNVSVNDDEKVIVGNDATSVVSTADCSIICLFPRGNGRSGLMFRMANLTARISSCCHSLAILISVAVYFQSTRISVTFSHITSR